MKLLLSLFMQIRQDKFVFLLVKLLRNLLLKYGNQRVRGFKVSSNDNNNHVYHPAIAERFYNPNYLSCMYAPYMTI